VWSPRLLANVALGMIAIEHVAVGTEVLVDAPDGTRSATVADLPFPGASQR
jgi:glycine cleavage system aminomethyltransferase T